MTLQQHDVYASRGSKQDRAPSISIHHIKLRMRKALQALAFGLCLIISACSLASAASLERSAGDSALFDYAVRLYQAGQFPAAYGRFRALANRGDVDAARIALFMLRNGELLYGTKWGTTPAEVSLWLALTGGQHDFQSLFSSD